MTREQVSRTLRILEHLRMASYEAESEREERELTAEYGRLWRSIESYVEGKTPYAAHPGAHTHD